MSKWGASRGRGSQNNSFGLSRSRTYTREMISEDQALVQEYARSRSEAAFAALVSRHVNLVYSVALRQVGNTQLAQDITQTVFLILARKAGTLSSATILSGWLCRTARYVSANVRNAERRRQLREQEAQMQSTLIESTSGAWEQIAPLLDEALESLRPAEHDALVLRFFEGKELKHVGAAQGTSEDAARMRVNRAVERLRKFFSRKGLTLSGAAIVGAVAANSVQAAPVGLVGAVTAAALSGTSITTAAMIAATKTIAMTTIQKVLVITTIALLTGATIYEARQVSRLRQQNLAFHEQQGPLTAQVQQLTRERDESARQLAPLANTGEPSTNDANELLRLRGEVSVLRRKLADAAAAPAPTAAPAQSANAGQPTDALEQQKLMAMGKGLDGRNYAAQLVGFALDNQGWFPTNWQTLGAYEKEFPASGTNSFELAFQPPLNRAALGTNAGRTILVREYLAWPTFDGRWGKIYGFADGHSETVILPDGNFTAWEQVNTFNPRESAK
jgi:RNA polymerase sigma factor (sigma-70 family)